MPFGGEEEKGIQGNFPEDKPTSETALLFLQLIMRKLRRSPSPLLGERGWGEGELSAKSRASQLSRTAVVLPSGTLFGDGVCTRIKEELLANGCNLDRKNPRAKEDITHLPPEKLAESIMEKEKRIGEFMGNIRKLLAGKAE